MKTSGLRLGTPALTTRGMGAAEMKQIAEMIHRVIVSKGDEATCDSVRQQAAAMCEQFPMP
jgi:glycine hydroxymethyltransferase